MNALSEREQSQGVAVRLPSDTLEWRLDDLLAALARQEYRLVLVLDKLQDPGNLGTLIRTADAVGDSAIILLEPGVDPFDPKTVRGTMGSIFTVPLARAQNPADFMPQLAARGYRLVGADGSRGESVWGQPGHDRPGGIGPRQRGPRPQPGTASVLAAYVACPCAATPKASTSPSPGAF
jgi:TrmH family RNA methyltransferase